MQVPEACAFTTDFNVAFQGRVHDDALRLYNCWTMRSDKDSCRAIDVVTGAPQIGSTFILRYEKPEV
jgi:hypothetical protein